MLCHHRIMMRWMRRRPWMLAALCVLVLVLMYLGVVWFSLDANAVMAAGTTLAAFGALGAAVESSTTARDATRALGLVTRPELLVEIHPPVEGDTFKAIIYSKGSYPVVQTRVQWTLHGRTTKVPALGPLGGGSPGAYELPKYEPIPIVWPAESPEGTLEVRVEYNGSVPDVLWRITTTYTRRVQGSEVVVDQSTALEER